MKYLEYPELEVLSRALTFEMSECRVFTRIEAYSCKAVNKEKRLFKSLESSYLLSASTSPPAYLEEALASPFGRLDQPSARKTLFLLIATLNGAFPDHDFSEVNPADFVRESSPTVVLNSLTSTLLSLRNGTGSPSSLGGSLDESPLLSSLARSPLASDPRPTSGGGLGTSASNKSPSARSTFASLPSVIDEIIHTADCEVYTFHPDMDSDPHASAEPDEEGGGDMYEMDPYDEGYSADQDQALGSHGARFAEGVGRGGGLGGGDHRDRVFSLNVQDSFGGTERTALSMAHESRMDLDTHLAADTPMFDEDMDTGTVASSSSLTTPTTFFSGASGLESPSLTVDEDDLAGAGAGLLWSTFAFFYNKRMKRILFVSVWSRKNSPLGTTPTMWSSPSLAPARTTTEDVPALGSNTQSLHDRLSERSNESRPAVSTQSSTARPFRARRAAPYSVVERRTPHQTRGRSASSSPAPSALSPFPHVQVPHAGTKTLVPNASATGGAATRTPRTRSSSTYASLDAAMCSVSAPGPRALEPLSGLASSKQQHRRSNGATHPPM